MVSKSLITFDSSTQNSTPVSDTLCPSTKPLQIKNIWTHSSIEPSQEQPLKVLYLDVETLIMSNLLPTLNDSKSGLTVPRGEKCKLTETQRLEIYNLKGIKSAYKVAPLYNVTHTTIYNIWKGQSPTSYKHALYKVKVELEKTRGFAMSNILYQMWTNIHKIITDILGDNITASSDLIPGDPVESKIPCPYCHKMGMTEGVSFNITCHQFLFIAADEKEFVVRCIGCKTLQRIKRSEIKP